MDFYTGSNLQYFWGKNVARQIIVENYKFEHSYGLQS